MKLLRRLLCIACVLIVLLSQHASSAAAEARVEGDSSNVNGDTTVAARRYHLERSLLVAAAQSNAIRPPVANGLATADAEFIAVGRRRARKILQAGEFLSFTCLPSEVPDARYSSCLPARSFTPPNQHLWAAAAGFLVRRSRHLSAALKRPPKRTIPRSVLLRRRPHRADAALLFWGISTAAILICRRV